MEVAPVLLDQVGATTGGKGGGGLCQVSERAAGDRQAVVWLVEHRVGERRELEQSEIGFDADLGQIGLVELREPLDLCRIGQVVVEDVDLERADAGA